MENTPARMTEVRLLAVVTVNVSEATLAEAATTSGKKVVSLGEVVASEVVSNLESVPYVASVIVIHL